MGSSAGAHLRAIGGGATAAALASEIALAGPAQVNVLITGETGLGKRLVGRLIHEQHNHGGRLVTLDCRGVSQDVIERELFGDSSCTGLLHLVQRGTLLLPNVDHLSVPNQTRLMRLWTVIEDGDLRIVGTTTGDLVEAIEMGRFRDDLFYRLNTIHLHLAPLRTRSAEIPSVTHHLLRRLARKYQMKTGGITAEALASLMRHMWPGNVRQLKQVLFHALRHAGSAAVDVPNLQAEVGLREPSARRRVA